MRYFSYTDSPVGRLLIAEEGGKLTHLLFDREGSLNSLKAEGEIKEEETALLKKTKKQLAEYFVGKRKAFDIPLEPSGTPFQLRCWEGLRTIPYGQTRDYKYIASFAGNPKACRAAGGANHSNPISIIVPCHRVVGADGSLTGFGGGLDVKAFLLNLEQRVTGGGREWKAE